MRRALFVGSTVFVLALAGSSAADEKEECIAAADEGQTLRDASKLLEARERFARCVRDTCPGALRKDCAQFLESIDASLPSLVITATDGSGRELAAVKVTEKDKVIAERLDGRALVLDPGEHWFHFTSAGKRPIDKTVIVKQGDKNQTLAVRFEEPGAPEPVVTASPPSTSTPTSTTSEGGGGSTQKIVGVTIGIAGVVTTIVGGVFGGLAASSWSDAKAKCGAACTSNDPAQETLASARTSAAFSTTFFIAGPILIATGVVVFLTSPKSSASASISPTANGILVSGRF